MKKINQNNEIRKTTPSEKIDVKVKKVMFCIPGKSFSGRFLDCWTSLLFACLQNNIQPILSRRESCNIYYVRSMCLGADVSRGKDQKPFDGKVDYDYIMWIDSDVLFNPAHFLKLIQDDKDVVTGIYHMEGSSSYAAGEDMDEDYFRKHGYFRPLADSDLGKELIEIAWSGMGFMLVKKGVFETLEYPWFKPINMKIGSTIDFTMEDVAFCMRVREKGFKIFVDPAVRIGHEKLTII